MFAFLENDPKMHKVGPTTYQIGDRTVDFAPHIGMPPTPGTSNQVQGAILGLLANSPLLMKGFDNLGKASLKKMVRQNPV
jgi:hypothetical protein